MLLTRAAASRGVSRGRWLRSLIVSIVSGVTPNARQSQLRYATIAS